MTALRDRLAGMKTYAYTNTRVRAMRADLITDDEYRKLQKMTLQEIVEFLGQRGYGDEIDALAGEYSGAELIERAITKNLGNTYMKLLRISPEPIQELLSTYYRKIEIENLKTILREKLRDVDAAGELMPTPNMDMETLRRYREMETADDVLDAFALDGFDRDLRTLLADADNLPEIEDTIDTWYYEHVQETATETKISQLFTEFLQLEVALKNIQLILRMTRHDRDRTVIEDRLIDIPEQQQVIPHDELLAAETYDDVVDRLEESDIGQFIEKRTPAEIGRALETYKLQKGIQMLHTDQLSINPILGFMICKEIEVGNLRMIAQAKEEELGTDFIDRNLVRGVAS